MMTRFYLAMVFGRAAALFHAPVTAQNAQA